MNASAQNLFSRIPTPVLATAVRRARQYLKPLGRMAAATAAVVSLTACVNVSVESKKEPKALSQQLHKVFADYRQSNFELNPINAMFEGVMDYNHRLGDGLSDDYLSQSLALEQRALESLRAIDRDALSEADRLSYDVFLYQREAREQYLSEGYGRLDTLIPVSQFFSLPNFMAVLGSGASTQPFATVADYDNWLERMGEFNLWVDLAIERMRQGMSEGVVQPRVLIERTLPQLQAHIVDKAEDSIFYKPLTMFPEVVSTADRERLTVSYREAIEQHFVPAYRRLHAFLQEEYLPTTRASVGLGDLPGGQGWYASKVREYTTTNLSADQIHEIGLQQVKLIREEMLAIKARVGFEGDLRAFFDHLRSDPKFQYKTEAELLQAYEDVRTVIDAGLPKLFDIEPRAPYVIRPTEAFRAASAAAAEYNSPAPDGSKPGIFYVNTYDLPARPTYIREALSIHEAAPGHHFQIAIAQELEGLPAFRKFDHVTAYVEGWGLYTESLGKDLGLYTDPYQEFGALTMAMWRACRLVVDTGMHAKGWSREQAIELMAANTALSHTDIVAEVERYIALPGQALAYMIGRLKLLELRERAQITLGDKYDIRDYHRVVLSDGSLPLSILEQQVDRWIATYN
ncbi:DUF885 domain-containing protein [Pseudomaricurvus alkylphenolicus]|uniref:DUF885 domain-containing protein n=1 Tax=Pseudomaricurvus alkylphenolicus TaxID=1306991 RepID=UPI0014222947|nr:DUF885 domain-containing protein [Pseudomaricurvus alkylphenolicus]NIB42707.1 DUF885 domain-containing protein [Pseudomaricurvus alkylphenolicus]